MHVSIEMTAVLLAVDETVLTRWRGEGGAVKDVSPDMQRDIACYA
ncbi:hypothetical protein [Paraburkholderia panacisoli]|nr:hypothetical protein [Paraburkholderia panacisoli]